MLGNKTLTLSTRVALFEITVATCFFNLAIWTPKGPAWDSMCVGHARLARRLLAHQLRDDRLFRLPLPVIMWKTGCLPLDLLAIRQRLSLLGSLVRAAPGLLWAALQAETDWMAQIRADLAWAISDREGQWPQLLPQAWPEWWRVLKDSPQRLKRLTKARIAEEQKARAEAEVMDICLWAMARGLQKGTKTQGRDWQWFCRKCAKGFDSKAKLSVHYFKVHQRVAMYRLYAQGTQCRACGTECWSEGRLAVHLRSSHKCVNALGAGGCAADQVTPGFGSKHRRRADLEQYTLAMPERTGTASQPSNEVVWHPSAKATYKEICDYLQDEAEGEVYGTILGKVQKIMIEYPLYRQEEKDVLYTINAEIEELQQDPDTSVWTSDRKEAITAQLKECLEWVSTPCTEQSTQRLQTLAEFKKDVDETDWATVLASNYSDGTRSTFRTSLPESWEADWRQAIQNVDLSAVADDLTTLLPPRLGEAWTSILEGKRVEVEAPQTFWACRLAIPFKVALASSAS